MRYGKVYFYDRMGNREPSEAEKIREALENFEAPRFRPPDEPRMMKNYSTGFSPLETPPPIIGSPVANIRIMESASNNMDLPANIVNFSGDSDDFRLPPNLDASDGLQNLNDRFRMDSPPDIYGQPPDDPIPSIVSPPNVRFNLGEDISKYTDQGIAQNGYSRNYSNQVTEMDQLTSNLGNIRMQTENEHDYGSSSANNWLDSGNHEICAQCRAEDDYMERMKRKAELERQKYDETMRKARIYENEMKLKEENMKKDEIERDKQLRNHIDRVNAELIELKRNRPKSPEQDNYIFRHESPRIRESDIRIQKDAYRAELDKQIEEKRLRKIAEFEKNEAIDATTNAKAALEFANAREAERRAVEHAKEMNRKQLEFQMEMSRIGAPIDKQWLWWAERPDEHGWRDARMKGLKHTNQVERNQTIKQSIGMLEEFKARQAHDDSTMRDLRRAKYDKLREQLHENSKMMYPGGGLEKSNSRPIITQPDPRVEAAWREAHEKYDKKYQVLQDNASRSISGAALIGASSSTAHACRRCARCARPLEKIKDLSIGRGETILPHHSLWRQ
ncbi:unnamed protein product [Caenorhabditis angaria]|uniref:Uncharacterized protein n=1 Tax=Caenorhabditis angaria TaxID=860376 RepID=A0A9P1N043_9PELO|nr:unnamed protein product [Caenorhabditis angaria]